MEEELLQMENERLRNEVEQLKLLNVQVEEESLTLRSTLEKAIKQMLKFRGDKEKLKEKIMILNWEKVTTKLQGVTTNKKSKRQQLSRKVKNSILKADDGKEIVIPNVSLVKNAKFYQDWEIKTKKTKSVSDIYYIGLMVKLIVSIYESSVNKANQLLELTAFESATVEYVNRKRKENLLLYSKVADCINKCKPKLKKLILKAKIPFRDLRSLLTINKEKNKMYLDILFEKLEKEVDSKLNN